VLGDVHQLIRDHGVEIARNLANDKLERQCVDAAFSVLSDEGNLHAICHSGFAMTALPHRSLKERVWERTGGPHGEIKLRIESGATANGELVGIPSGAIARLLLIHLSSEAVRNNSRVVEMGSSMRASLIRMGISPGGKSFTMVRDQARKISLCRLTFYNKGQKSTAISNGSFVRNAVLCNDDSAQLALWNDVVELDEVYFKSLIEYPLPLREAAIRELSGRSMAIDIYVFLSYELHKLEKSVPISWQALYAQFGAGFKQKKVFVNSFKEPLALALAAYPEAKVTVSETGLLLHPSESPVPKTHPRAGRLLTFPKLA
jgi:hypothetical protein